jgi:hypothetical protein
MKIIIYDYLNENNAFKIKVKYNLNFIVKYIL